MAESLDIANPAQDIRCTSCHAPFAALKKAEKLESARPEEGVSCESCHGAAGSWVRTHTRTDVSRPQRVAAGMRDLEDLYLRTNTCVACHQVIEPDLLAAGHPRLHFEQAGLSEREPRHWQELWSDPQLWLVGQTAALRELSGKWVASGGDAWLHQEWTFLYGLLQAVGPTVGRSWTLPSGLDKPDSAFVRACDAQTKALASLRWSNDLTLPLLHTLVRHSKKPGPASEPAAFTKWKWQRISASTVTLAGALPAASRTSLSRPLSTLKLLDSTPGPKDAGASRKALADLLSLLEKEPAKP
jgi:hypothetical protein